MAVHDIMASDPAREDQIILVDGLDRQIGEATKEQAHCEGLLHRAFSVVLVRDSADDDNGSGPGARRSRGVQLLLAQRAEGKYHCGGLWANSCCSHPRAGEELMDAAYRRVREELGVDAEDLRELASFIYRAPFESGLVEYEYDHVILGSCAGEPNPDPTEVGATRWVGVQELSDLLAQSPQLFTPWAFTVLSMTIAALADGECASGPLS